MKFRALPFVTAGLLSFVLLSFRKSHEIPSSAAVRNDKPNIIFILTDDQRFDALGAMGNSIIQTPHLDKLANEGILFKNAYVTTSICCVSRASLLSGQYESRHQINDFTTDFTPEAFSKTYPALFKEAGYTLGFIGKFGVGKKPPEALFDYWRNTEPPGKNQPDYITPDKNGNPIHDTDTISHAISDFLRQYAMRAPFCLSVSFKAPHEQDGNPPKYIVQQRFADYYRSVTIPTPVTATQQYWRQMPDFFRTKDNVARTRWRGLFGTPILYQENVKNYYRLISGVDEAVGKLVAGLDSLNLSKKTIIVFMGDNGMMLGEHGMEGKWFGYEESIRVPLFIYDPELPHRLQHLKAGQLALNIDIAPTLLGMAGIEAPATMQGVNLISMLENKIPERKDFFYQHYFLGSPHIPSQQGVVTKDLKYMKYIEHNYEELFDISKDPHETHNLVTDPAYQQALHDMRARYDQMADVVF